MGDVERDRPVEGWRVTVLERIATRAPLPETLATLMRLVEARRPGAMGAMMLLERSTHTLRPAVAGKLPAAYLEAIDHLPVGPCVGSCGTAAYRGQSVFVEDVANDPLWVGYRELAREHHVGACWSTPILSRRRSGTTEVLGTFALYFDEPTSASDVAPDYLAEPAALAAIAIEADAADAALRDSERRFRTFVDHAVDAFFVHDARTAAVVDVNAQACAALGYTREELIGASPALYDGDVSPDRLWRLQERLQSGEAVTFEARHRRKDGSSFPVEVRVRGFVQQGRALNLALVRDISERVALEQRLRQSSKMEAIGRLAGGVAHDFNNLLTIVSAQSDYLFETMPADDPLRAEIDVLRDASARGAALTAQLLAFGRRTIVAPAPIVVALVVERLAHMFRRILGERIELVNELRSGTAAVFVDRGLMEQVVTNLVVNARDAMPRGGRITIATHVVEVALAGGDRDAKAPRVSIAVTDTGDGMTEEVRAHVFEPFFTTKPAGAGTGLGLATVYGIVTGASGHVDVVTKLGVGTTLTVYLPLVAPESEAPRPPAPVETERNGAETVLVVEDENALLRVIVRGLTARGYEVLGASDGKEALRIEAGHTGAIDVLVTDVVMPGMGGRALAETMRERRPGIRVIFVSGYTDDELVREGISAGAATFAQKPFTVAALAEQIRLVLARHEPVPSIS